MIINTNAWKKMLKNAEKTGVIIVGSKDEWLIVSDGHWIVNVKPDTMSKKELAAYIEVVGRIPNDGEWLKLADDELSPIEEKGVGVLPEMSNSCQIPSKTEVMFDAKGTLLRCYQSAFDLSVHWYPEVQICAVNEKELYKARQESEKFGFYATNHHVLIWRNETSAYGIVKMHQWNEDLDTLLGSVDINFTGD